MRWAVVLLTLWPGFGFAQTRPARPAPKKAPAKTAPKAPALPADKWPISALAVEGAPDYAAEQVLAVAGLKIGQLAGKAEFDAAHDRLAATGMFETVGYKFEAGKDGKSYTGTFQLTETEPLLPLVFYQLGVPDADLLNLFRGKDPLFPGLRLPSNRVVIDRYTNWLREYLASKDLDGKITGEATAWPTDVAIVFRPAKTLPSVAEVTFEGNQALTQDALREAIAGAGVGSQYTEGQFRLILDASVRTVYESRGHLRVAFPKIRTEPDPDVTGVHVFVTVDEGKVYKLSKVGIVGPSPVRPAELIKTADIPTGDAANFDRVNSGLDNVRKALRRAGYLDAKATAERDIHDADSTVDVAIRIDAGAQYAMGKLSIVGLDLEATAEIQRMWTLKEGRPFNPEYPATFLASVRDQGLFDNLGATKSEIRADEKNRKVDVTLTFTGAGPQAKPGRTQRPGRGRAN